MARTRAQEKAGVLEDPPVDRKTPSKKGAARKHDRDEKPEPPHKKQKTQQKPKSASGTREESGDRSASAQTTTDPTVKRLIDQYGAIPLSNTKLDDPQTPSAETLLALLLNAMFSSARISHTLAAKTTATVIQAGYHKLHNLKGSTWQARTEVLTEGGYTRYREKTATYLGELADFMETKCDGDLNNLIKSASGDQKKVRAALKEIKGLGDVGIDIFLDTSQGVLPSLAPFIDPRSAKTAEAVGINSDAKTLWQKVGQDHMQMCKLASALTTVRLEKAENEITK